LIVKCLSLSTIHYPLSTEKGGFFGRPFVFQTGGADEKQLRVISSMFMSEAEALQIIERLKTGEKILFDEPNVSRWQFEYLPDKRVFYYHSEDRRANMFMPEKAEQYFTEQSLRRWLMVHYSFKELCRWFTSAPT
jgi:hypothetical protein